MPVRSAVTRWFDISRWPMARKLEAMAGTLLLLAALVLGEIVIGISRADQQINSFVEQQSHILGEVRSLRDLRIAFVAYQNSLIEMDLTWDYEMETIAEQKRAELEQMAGALQAIDPELMQSIPAAVSKSMELMLAAKDAYVDGNRAEGNRNLKASQALIEPLLAGVAVRHQERFDALAEATGRLRANNSALLLRGLFGLGVMVVVGALMAVLLPRSILKPMGAEPEVLRHIAATIASGDLRGEIRTGGKTPSGAFAAMVTMRNRLLEVLAVVRDVADEVQRAAGDLAIGQDTASDRAAAMAERIARISANMQNLTTVLQDGATSAERVHALASEARSQADRGGVIVRDGVCAIQAISDASERIVDITRFIDGIAFQTNLLALNASVEAARAGDQGRGFAVVAAEVRNLAGRSAAAAKEIKELIDDSNAKVRDGVRLVNDSGEHLERIVGSVGKVAAIVGDMALASREQTRGIEQVNGALRQMEELTRSNTDQAAEAERLGGTLDERARRLMEAIAFFRTRAGAGERAFAVSPRNAAITPIRPANADRESARPALAGAEAEAARTDRPQRQWGT